MKNQSLQNFQSVRRQFITSAAAGIFAIEARADAPYPNKPLKLINSFAAGSGTDNTGRMIADGLAKKLGQPVVVENRPGANMIIGSEYAAKQPADGYTLIMVTLDNMGINPSLYRNPGYSIKDFDPLTLVGTLPLVMMTSSGSKFGNLQELRAAHAASGKPFSFATWGIGSVSHMYGELIKAQSGIPMEFIPFPGAAPATNATLGGHVDLTLATAFNSVSYIKGGQAKGLAVGGDSRVPDLPQVQTFTEQGLPNVGALQWHGISVRAAGQQQVIDKLYSALKDVLNDPVIKERILKTGYGSIDGRSPAAFASFISAESAKWAAIVKASGVTAER